MVNICQHAVCNGTYLVQILMDDFRHGQILSVRPLWCQKKKFQTICIFDMKKWPAWSEVWSRRSSWPALTSSFARTLALQPASQTPSVAHKSVAQESLIIQNAYQINEGTLQSPKQFYFQAQPQSLYTQ